MPTVLQLKAELKQLGVKGYSGKLKAELIYMLEATKKAKEEVKNPEPIKDIPVKRAKPKIGKSWAEKDEELEDELRKNNMNNDIPPAPEPPRHYIDELIYDTELGARNTANYKIYGEVSPISAISGVINGLKIQSKGIPKLLEYCDNVLNWIEKIKVPSSRGFVVLMKDWEKLRKNIKILHKHDEFMRNMRLPEDPEAKERLNAYMKEKAEQKKAEQKRAEREKDKQDDYEMKQSEKQLKKDIESALSAMGAMGANRRFVKEPTAAQKSTGAKFVLNGFVFH